MRTIEPIQARLGRRNLEWIRGARRRESTVGLLEQRGGLVRVDHALRHGVEEPESTSDVDPNVHHALDDVRQVGHDLEHFASELDEVRLEGYGVGVHFEYRWDDGSGFVVRGEVAAPQSEQDPNNDRDPNYWLRFEYFRR